VVTLALNMQAAAQKAHNSGRFEEAGAKYTKAARYLEQSTSLYDHDREMFTWTQGQLRECRTLAEHLGGSTSAGQQLPASSKYLLRRHYDSRREYTMIARQTGRVMAHTSVLA
jgi:hypothetical protein